MNDRSRIAKWDNAKFFLMAAVVTGHFLQAYDDAAELQPVILFIYTFHMPAFIFLFGLFSKRRIKENDIKGASLFLVLFVAMKTVLYAERLVMGYQTDFEIFSESGVPWFAFAVFVFLSLTMLLKRIGPKILLPLSVIIGCAAGYFGCIGDFLVLSRILVFYPFFLAGYYLSSDKLTEMLDHKKIRWVSIAVIAVLVVGIIFRHEWFSLYKTLLSGKYSYEDLPNPSAGGVLRLFYYAYVSGFIIAVMAVIPSKKRIYTAWGQRTLQVYALHQCLNYLLIYLGYDILLKMIAPTYWTLLLIPVSIIITIGLSCWKLKLPSFKNKQLK